MCIKTSSCFFVSRTVWVNVIEYEIPNLVYGRVHDKNVNIIGLTVSQCLWGLEGPLSLLSLRGRGSWEWVGRDIICLQPHWIFDWRGFFKMLQCCEYLPSHISVAMMQNQGSSGRKAKPLRLRLQFISRRTLLTTGHSTELSAGQTGTN